MKLYIFPELKFFFFYSNTRLTGYNMTQSFPSDSRKSTNMMNNWCFVIVITKLSVWHDRKYLSDIMTHYILSILSSSVLRENQLTSIQLQIYPETIFPIPVSIDVYIFFLFFILIFIHFSRDERQQVALCVTLPFNISLYLATLCNWQVYNISNINEHETVKRKMDLKFIGLLFICTDSSYFFSLQNVVG